MRRFSSFWYAFLLPALASLVILPGCDGGAVTTKGKSRRGLIGSGEEAEVARVAVADSPHSTITGKVIYDGVPPTPQPLSRGANESQCHADAPFQEENYEEDWLVDKDTKGVQNAVIFLQPPAGKYFKLTPDQEKSKGDVVIDQPLCGFRPRVFVVFPSFYDLATMSQKPTGQKLIIKNSAPFSHNYNMISNSSENRDKNSLLSRGQESVFDNLVPQTKYILIKCDIHSWMRAYGFILEHPYWAITKADGSFKLENVPVDVPVQLVGWHEAAGFFHGGQEGTPTKLKDKQTLDFSIKSRLKS